METHAWRLQWPTGFTVFEIDTQQVLAFKHRILSSGSSSSSTESQQTSQHQQQQPETSQLPPLSCERRVVVAADASKAQGGWERTEHHCELAEAATPSTHVAACPTPRVHMDVCCCCPAPLPLLPRQPGYC